MMRRGDNGGYDRSLTMFNPDGRIFQVEYAMEAVRRGTLAVGIKSSKGACIVTLRKYTKIMEPESIQKIFAIDEHIGAAISGLHADSRILVDYARVQCQIYRLEYDEPCTVNMITRRIASIKQQYTQHGGVRPFGSSLMLIGVDPDGTPRLMTTSPSGTYMAWYATAVGRGSAEAKEKLENQYNPEASLEEIIKLGISVVKEVTDEDVTDDMLSIAAIDAESKKFKILSEEEIAEYVS